MIIRRATPSDFLSIAALDREAWRDNRHAEFIPDGEHVWRVWCEHTLVFCACEPENSAASRAPRKSGPPPTSSVVGAVLAFPCLNGQYCLHKIFVAREHRGRGLGSRLIEALITGLDTMGVDVFLTVDPANDAAVGLYERWGFTERRVAAGYYREHEDRFILGRRHSGLPGNAGSAR